jgi:hypothetical protein
MKTSQFSLIRFRATFAAAVLTSMVCPLQAQTTVDAVEVVRSSIRADRKVIITEVMQFTEHESRAFWPLYQQYRTETDKVGDELVKLLLEYMDAYPNVPEMQALRMLKDYATLEKKQAQLKEKFIGRFTKILPASKVIRYFQLENRLDLAVKVELAGFVSMAPPDQVVAPKP